MNVFLGNHDDLVKQTASLTNKHPNCHGEHYTGELDFDHLSEAP